MPNWVRTKIQFDGENAEKNFRKAVELFIKKEKEERIFDFNRLVEMPKELAETVSPTNYFNSLEAVDYLTALVAKENGKATEEDEKRIRHYRLKDGEKEHLDEYMALWRKYGAADWYFWAWNNWGTKWNACDCEIDEDQQAIFFSTAWEHPFPIIQRIADHPAFRGEKLELLVVYCDEAQCTNFGKYSVYGAKTVFLIRNGMKMIISRKGKAFYPAKEEDFNYCYSKAWNEQVND